MLAKLWHNEHIRVWFGQCALLAGVVIAIGWLLHNTMGNLAARGIKVGPEFLFRPSNFPISESVLPFDPADPFWWSYVVGFGNTLFISVLAILCATLLGLFVGLARRSAHPLIAGIGSIFVTTMRNMPLLVILLFFYALATTALPVPREAWSPLPGVFMTRRGIYMPWIELGANGAWFYLATLAGLIGAIIAIPVASGRRKQSMTKVALAIMAALALLLWGAWTALGLDATPTVPSLKGLNFTGGFRLSTEFGALLVGLVLYTAAFIGEIIRGGIDAVAKGQWEAGRALGLSERHILIRIVIPQALRVIVPPLTTQYLSTVKNTTLALAVGYPELGLIVGTVINQTGQAVESILIMLAVFLSVSLSVSVFMNWYNARVALVVR